MFKNLGILNLASAMTAHSAQRHAVIAENIANADTPDYKAKDVQPFSEIFKAAQTDGSLLDARAAKVMIADTGDALSPNGNSVSLEDEMMKSSVTMNNHELSLQIYKKSLAMMKIAIGKNI